MSAYLKAIVGGAIAFLGSLATALVDDKSLGDLTDGQWIVAIIALLTALAAVWGTPNSEPPA